MAAALTLERHDAVLVATLAHAPVNAFDEVLIDALDDALGQAVDDESVVVLHLRSALRVFGAGADLALMRACFATPDGPDRMVALVGRMQQLFARLEAAPLLTLVEMGGAALGAGLELALACDLRVAAAEARLGLPEVGLGLLPGAGGTQRLTQLLGPGLARRLVLGAEVLDGTQALALGLVHWAPPRAQLAGFTQELAARHAALPRAALAGAKRCIAAALEPGRDGYALERTETRALYDHPETRRRVSAFLTRGQT